MLFTPLRAPVVQKVNSAIHRINLYPVVSAIGFTNTYPLDTDLSHIYPMDSAIQLLNNWGLVDNSTPLLCFLYFLRHVTDHCCQGWESPSHPVRRNQRTDSAPLLLPPAEVLKILYRIPNNLCQEKLTHQYWTFVPQGR